MSWPKEGFPADWPEDKKTGLGFLAELMRRYPGQVQAGSLVEGQHWLDKDGKAGGLDGQDTKG